MDYPAATATDAVDGTDPVTCAPAFSTHAVTKKPIRRLWGSGKGKFTTKGKYAAATVRGTIWLVADFCNGTRVTVKRGLVAVQNLATHKTKLVKAGQSFFVSSTPPKKKKKK